MSDLEIIAADLRRQREQLERALEDTSSRCDSTADLIRKIEELNRRVAETQIEKRVADR